MAVASTVAGVYCWDDRVSVKEFNKPKVCPIRILCTPKYFLNVLRTLGEFKTNYPNMEGTVSSRVSIIWQFNLNSFRPTQWPCYLPQRLHLQNSLLLTAIDPRPKSGPKKLWRAFKYSLRVLRPKYHACNPFEELTPSYSGTSTLSDFHNKTTTSFFGFVRQPWPKQIKLQQGMPTSKKTCCLPVCMHKFTVSCDCTYKTDGQVANRACLNWRKNYCSAPPSQVSGFREPYYSLESLTLGCPSWNLPRTTVSCTQTNSAKLLVSQIMGLPGKPVQTDLESYLQWLNRLQVPGLRSKILSVPEVLGFQRMPREVPSTRISCPLVWSPGSSPALSNDMCTYIKGLLSTIPNQIKETDCSKGQLKDLGWALSRGKYSLGPSSALLKPRNKLFVCNLPLTLRRQP